MSSLINIKLKEALYHQSEGRSVIPVGPDKKPLIEWKQYQSKCATEEEIQAWWRQWPNANPAMVTGAISGLVVLDIDAKHGRSSKDLPSVPVTAYAKSGNGGEHLYFKYPGVHVKSDSGIFGLGIDIRGDGGCIVLPPSVNAHGGTYEWVIPIADGVAEMPEWLLSKVVVKGEKKWLQGANGVSEGLRNDTSASMAGKILYSTVPELWESIGWDQFTVWNSKCTPPLSERELKSTWESIKRLHTTRSNGASSETGKESQADKLVKLVRGNPAVTLFRSELDEPFIKFPVHNHFEYWPCKDKQTKWWLSQEFWKQHGKTANNDAVGTAMNAIQGFASYEGEKHTLSNRVAPQNECIYYSLSNDDWEAVKITGDGWETICEVPILFRRQPHQTAQMIPQISGSVMDVFKFINIKRDDHKLLFLVWLVSCFIPDFPHPILYLYGPQGSAKSTTSRLLKRIIDPSKIDTFEVPKDQKELVQLLSHHWCLMFDNVSHLSSEMSDILCRAVTGSGFTKRELYSDDSVVIYNFKRCISINGINLMAVKADLLERTLLIELERVSKDERKNEQDLYREFDAMLPGILGGIFDIVSKTIKIRPTVVLPEAPRMADFAMWGYAISEALEYGGEKFMECYYRNINQQTDEVIADSFEASFMVSLVNQYGYWEGSASKLLKLMEQSPDLDSKHRELPKNSQALSHKLKTLKATLDDAGVVLEWSSGRVRKIIAHKVGVNIATTASAPLFEGADADDF